MPTMKPIPGSDKERPLKTEWDEQRYVPTPRRSPLPAPSVGIFEEPTRCVQINKEWWSHVSGMIDVLSSPELWEGDSEEQTRAIREIAALLATENCGMTIDYDAMAAAICDGLVCAAPKIGLMLAQGASGGGSFDEDGNIVLPPSAGGDTVELPDDDPTTPFDDTLAAQMGGTIAVTKALELLYDRCDSLYGVTNGAPSTPEADAQTLIKAFFPCDGALMDTSVAQYYTYRGTNSRLLFDPTPAMQNYMFCRGGGERAWGQWLSDQSGYVIGKFNVMNALSIALSEEFWSSYFGNGASKPSTQYLDASCVAIAPQTLTAMVFASARTTTPLKASHRMLMKVKGYALDVDGDTQDWFWYRTAAGVNTFTAPTFTHSSGSNLPSQNQVVWNAGHEYEYTIDLGALNAAMLITLNKHASMNAVGLTYPVPFEITLEDLGEYAV